MIVVQLIPGSRVPCVVLAVFLAAGTAACTGTSHGKTSHGDAGPSSGAARTVTVTPSPACPPTSAPALPNTVATLDGARVGKPVLEPSGKRFRVAVQVSNCSSTAQKYQSTVRLVGSYGYLAMLIVNTPSIPAGQAFAATYTAEDHTPGAIVPHDPHVTISGVYALDKSGAPIVP